MDYWKCSCHRLVLVFHDSCALFSGSRVQLPISSICSPYFTNSWRLYTPQLVSFSTVQECMSQPNDHSTSDPNKQKFVHSDALDTLWSGSWQVQPVNPENAHRLQRHEPPEFLFSRFNGPKQGWSILEKEPYTVLVALKGNYWLLETPEGFDLFTDQNNLIFISDPLSVVPKLSQTGIWNFLRGTERLSHFAYTFFHIIGEDNLRAHFLRRWLVAMTRRLLTNLEQRSAFSDEFGWPISESFRQFQDDYSASDHR